MSTDSDSPSATGSWLAGSDAPEKTVLKVGFVPLSDCAPLVVAEKLALGQKHGIALTLLRQPSWAAVRDKLLSGELDAAHTLYGLVYGVKLGLGGPQGDLSILMTLNQNGQGITLSSRIAAALQRGQTLREWVADTTEQERRPVFAHTFPTGTHAMWLYYWLAAQGVHPLDDIKSVVIPPPQMSAALADGLLDGFCCGEPWPAVAEASGAGPTVVRSSAIWPDHPEKVLACQADFVTRYPNTARALTMTMLEACRWLDDGEHRRTAAQWLSEPSYIGYPSQFILPRLLGAPGQNSPHNEPVRFHADGKVNFPYLSDGAWFISQYQRWGMLQRPVDMTAIAMEINQTSLYREAALAVGVEIPAGDSRTSVLIDDVCWDGHDPEAYAAAFSVHAHNA
jgi:ABC-type nitrate/sulfonate/bicarbonate transport system substrate-binding protein